MGLSETIIAASIGAAATLSTALFQLFSAFRANNSRSDVRPKRGSAVKSILAVIALMIVSSVGGFLFAEFRNERSADDMHSMRDDINAKLQMLAETTGRLAERSTASVSAGPVPIPATPVQVVAATNSVESVIFAPACQDGTSCTEANSQPMALCGAIPNAMEPRKFNLSIKTASATESSKADFGQDLGGAKFLGPPVAYPQGENRKVVCVNFLHWSDEPHIATLILQYGASVEVGPGNAQQLAPTAVAVIQTLPDAHTVSMTAQSAMP